MRARLMLTAAMLLTGTPALGQADKPVSSGPSRQETARDRTGPRALVLASNELARSAANPAPQPSTAKKKVEPRVTTCRCGDAAAPADPDVEDR